MDLKKLLLLIFSINIFSACSSDKNIEKEVSKEDLPIKNIEEEKKYEIISEKDGLSVNEKCIGCGKCAFVAPDNFLMNGDTFKADVISGENKSGEEVQRAIQICPVDAISA